MTATPPDISVIVLSYNQQDTIARTLDSILAQQLGPYSMEIVVGDDASTDSTRQVAEDYSRRFPETVRLMPAAANKGVVRNYFDTLAACRGRYIADCSADDCWIWHGKLRRQAAMLDADNTLVMAVTQWMEVTPGQTPPPVTDDGAPETSVTPGHTLIAPLLAHESRLHLSTALYRASAAREALADEPAMVCNPDFGCEDLPLMAALIARGDVAQISIPSLAYTVADGTVSKPVDPERALRYFVATVECTALLAERYDIPARRLRGYFTDRLNHIARLALRVRRCHATDLARRACATAGFTPLKARLLIDAADLLSRRR